MGEYSSKSPDAATNTPEMEEGAPIPEGMIDPELVRLRRAAPPLGWLLAFSVVAVCGFFVYATWGDFLYWMRGTEPVSELARDANNVRFAAPGPLDRSWPFIVDDSSRAQLFPVHGSSMGLWVATKQGNDDGGETYLGRIKQLDDLAYANSLRAAVNEVAAQPRYVSPADVEKGSVPVADIFGNTVSVEDDTKMSIEVQKPGELEILFAKTKRGETKEMAAKQLASALSRDDVKFLLEGERYWSFLVSTQQSKEIMDDALVAAGFRNTVARYQYEARTTSWGKFRESGWGTVLEGEVDAQSLVASVSFLVKPILPANVQVLLEGDDPREHWSLSIIYALLVLVCLVTTYGFWRSRRRA